MTLKQLREKRKFHEELIAENPKYKDYLIDLDQEERKLINARNEKIKKSLKLVSNIILWFCAVGGFVLALVQFFND